MMELIPTCFCSVPDKHGPRCGIANQIGFHWNYKRQCLIQFFSCFLLPFCLYSVAWLRIIFLGVWFVSYFFFLPLLTVGFECNLRHFYTFPCRTKPSQLNQVEANQFSHFGILNTGNVICICGQLNLHGVFTVLIFFQNKSESGYSEVCSTPVGIQ